MYANITSAPLLSIRLQERLIRNLNYLRTPPSTTTSTSTSTTGESITDSNGKRVKVDSTTTAATGPSIVYSILLNPTPTDTGGGTAQLRLTLGYGTTHILTLLHTILLHILVHII